MGLDLHSPRELVRWIGRTTGRLAILLAGLAVVGAGLAMLVLPGPGVLVVILGLAILATEFAWAERALDRTTVRAATATSKVTARRSGKVLLGVSALSMMLGGSTVGIVSTEHRVVGATVLLAGVIALVTLLPRVQRWLDAKATEGTARTNRR